MNKRYRFAVIGYGWRGSNHANNLESMKGVDARCVAVADMRCPSPEERKRFGEHFYDDYQKMLRAEEIDFVLIASPESFHVEQALAVLRLGLPVFLEKAISNTWRGATRLYREVQKNQYPLFVGYNLRRMPVARVVQQLVEAGEIGFVQNVLGHVNTGSEWSSNVFLRAFYRNAELSGDIVLSKLTHDTEWVQNVLKTSARVCTATVARNVWTSKPKAPLTLEMKRLVRLQREEPTSHDFCCASGLFENETAFSFVFTTVGPDYERRYTFNGTKGQIDAVLHSRRSGKKIGTVLLWRCGENPRAIPVPNVRGGHGGSDRLVLQEFIQWLGSERRLPYEPDSILTGMLIPSAALESARKGRVVDCGAMLRKAKAGNQVLT